MNDDHKQDGWVKLLLKVTSKTIIPYIIVVVLNVIVMEDLIEFEDETTL